MINEENIFEQNLPDNIYILKKYFPQCFDKEGNFNLEKFKEEIKINEINLSKESYSLEWLGKSYARVLTHEPVRTFIKEDEEFNSKEENRKSQNLLIKGDNLEVLKHLLNAYREKIKMIYIDPPYNTGKDDFVYQDDRKFSKEELSKLAGISEEKAKRILDFVNSKSNSHSAWLTFMYPRLYIARQFLREDGVIFVSIDDNEVAQLKILMDEIFGEENFIALLSVENNPKGRKNSNFVSISNDYCLIYAKNKGESYFIENLPKLKTELKVDEFGRYYTHGKRVIVGESSNKEVSVNSDKHYTVYYNESEKKIVIKKEENINTIDVKLIQQGYKRYISTKNGKFIENTYTSSKFKELFETNSLIFKENSIYEKDFNTFIRIKSILKNTDEIDLKTETAGTYLNNLFGIPNGKDKKIFDNPKNPSFIKLLITLFEEKDFLILDFFSGSGTTGDAVMQLNAEDGGNRKYILVQLPEPIEEKKNKTAYDFVKNELKVDNPTIFDITKERLIRAAKKIKEDVENELKNKKEELEKIINKKKKNKKDEEKIIILNEEINKLEKKVNNIKNQDLGFKIFETIPNNEGKWESYKINAKEFNPKIKLFDENKLTNDDLKTLLTTWKLYDGIILTEDLKELDLDGYKSYYHHEKGILYLINKEFKTENLKKLLEEIDENPNFNPLKIIAFGYHFESKVLREIAENLKNYINKKESADNIEFIVRY
ncbi:DNA methylase [Marinitoga sp. 1135]|uniref:Adenine specific DNA methylase Mod n=1 Tax=Marinitoga piezophila (strain DSM 14283 / JCM 11233 / KA3) TaxID=443254 RepID=H2J3H6_MARPK|nr:MULTISPECIES: site-specific DNA-methyltransferase [Marinitoga]AEX84620.1 adenine specific DNA methylase Mod [Marinitoga piezophila KA3]NUU94909.1 DNA methylase [Marinitoga sp. 1135]